MTIEANKSIIRRFLEYHVNKGITEGFQLIETGAIEIKKTFKLIHT